MSAETAGAAVTGEGTAAPALVITVYGTPAPQGSKRHVGRGIMVESSAKVKPWREAVKWAAIEAIDTHGWQQLRKPLAAVVRVTFTLARPQSHYRTGRNAHLLRDAAPTFPATTPDLDKLLRSSLDALGFAAVWQDDSQVARIVTDKVYGATPGAHIVVREYKP